MSLLRRRAIRSKPSASGDCGSGLAARGRPAVPNLAVLQELYSGPEEQHALFDNDLTASCSSTAREPSELILRLLGQSLPSKSKTNRITITRPRPPQAD
jgi:hypothetical protein